MRKTLKFKEKLAKSLLKCIIFVATISDMEILDLYDKDLRLSGRTIERGLPVPEGYLIPIVVVFIRNDMGKYLIQRVSKMKGSHYATTAGHVQTGERNFAMAMCREIREELGIVVNPDSLQLIEIREFRNKFTYLYYLNWNLSVDKFILQKEEVESVIWMDFAQIERLYYDNMFQKDHYHLLLDYRDSLQIGEITSA